MSNAFMTGSRRYGTPKKSSDLDLVVLVSPAEFPLLAKVATALASQVKGKPADYDLAATSDAPKKGDEGVLPAVPQSRNLAQPFPEDFFVTVLLTPLLALCLKLDGTECADAPVGALAAVIAQLADDLADLLAHPIAARPRPRSGEVLDARAAPARLADRLRGVELLEGLVIGI